MKCVCLTLILAFALQPACAEELLPRGEIIQKVQCRNNPEKSYGLYLPSQFSPDRSWPLLLLFDPRGRGAFPLRFFKKAAEEYGFILACTYDTANYTPWDENRVGIEAMWNDILQRFPIEPKRMYVGGMSGGARLASRVAFTTGQVQGLIACAAGFWVQTTQTLPPEFEVVSTVGTEDFNFLELVDLENDLNMLKVPNRRVVFHGPHWWPDEDIILEALGYLQIRAYRKGLVGLEAVRVADQVKHRAAQAEILAEADDLYHAVLRYSEIVSDFNDLIDLSREKARLKELMDSKDYKTQARNQKKAEKKEDGWRRDFLSRLKHGEDLAPRDPIATRKELNWWKRELGSLTKRMKDSKNPRERSAATRIFSMVWANIYESSIYLLRQKELEKAIFTNGLAEMMKPEHFIPPFNLACAYALAGDPDKAFEALDRCVANRFPGAHDKLTSEPMLDSLKKDPRFKAALEKLPPKK